MKKELFNKLNIKKVAVLFLIIVVCLFVSRKIFFPEFVDIEFYNVQPLEGNLIFKSNGFVYSDNEGEETKRIYFYNIITNEIKTFNHTIKIKYYDKKEEFIYTYYDGVPTIIKSENSPYKNDIFINTNEKLNIKEQIKIDNFIISKNGTVTEEKNILYDSISKKQYKGSIACLKNTKICNFYKIVDSNNNEYIYEINGNNFIKVKY